MFTHGTFLTGLNRKHHLFIFSGKGPFRLSQLHMRGQAQQPDASRTFKGFKIFQLADNFGVPAAGHHRHVHAAGAEPESGLYAVEGIQL